METVTVKKQYPAIDIVKIIMAVAVVVMHRPLFSESSLLANYICGNIICGISVPFFFIVSAFLLFSKIFVDPENAKKRFIGFEKRIFKLYLIWSIIYLPCIFVKNHTGHYDEITIKMLISQCIFTVKTFFLSQSFIHLWYLNTMMLSVAIIYFLSKKLSSKAILTISIITFLLFNLYKYLSFQNETIKQIYNFVPSIFYNVFRCGFFCTSLGALAADLKKDFSVKKLSVIFVILLSVCIALGFGLFKSRESFILNSLVEIFQFGCSFKLCLICLNIKAKPSKKYIYFRNVSILMYLSHLLLMSEGYSYIAQITGFTALVDCNILRFIITLLFGFAISNIILFLEDKKRFRWLRNLY